MVRGGRSFAMRTAIHGSGIDTPMIAIEIHGFSQMPYATAAKISAGNRNDMMSRYLRTRARCCSSIDRAASVIRTGLFGEPASSDAPNPALRAMTPLFHCRAAIAHTGAAGVGSRAGCGIIEG